MGKEEGLISDYVESLIERSIGAESSFEDVSKTCGFAEIADKLFTCLMKLYRLKDEQANLAETQKDEAFLLLKKDIELCKERSLLKRALDAKLIELIKNKTTIIEQKSYGDSNV